MNLRPLQLAVWEKAKGNRIIAKGTHHYRDISEDIHTKTGYSIGPDTIRNFLEGRNKPRKALLDIYATYVLGGTTEEAKTYQEFEVFLQKQPVLEQIGQVFEDGRKRIWIIVVFLVLIVFLFIIMIYRKKLTKPLTRQIISENSVVSAPDQDRLNYSLPEETLLKNILKNFPFDDNETASLDEGQRILEWLGIRQINDYGDSAEPYLSGYLPTGCIVTISVGTYGKRDAYGLSCNCNGVDSFKFKPIYLELVKPIETEEWAYHFNTPTLTKLDGQGWTLLKTAIDSTIFNELNNGEQRHLVLPTMPGDSWIERHDVEPSITNILTHHIHCGSCCELSVMISDFNPSHDAQQAGFFLYYGEEEYPSIRFTLFSNGYHNRIQLVRRDGKNANRDLVPPWPYLKRTKICEITNPKTSFARPEHPIDSIVLKLTLNRDEYFCSYKIDNNDFVPVASMIVEFDRPHTIGLTAFQGPSKNIPAIPVTDAIDAKFEYVIVKNCE